MVSAISVPGGAPADNEQEMLQQMFMHALSATLERVQRVSGQSIVPATDFVLPVVASPAEAPDERAARSAVRALSTYTNPLQPSAEPLCAQLVQVLSNQVDMCSKVQNDRLHLMDKLCTYFTELQTLQSQMAVVMEHEWARWGGADRAQPDPLIGNVEHAPHWLIAGLQNRDTPETVEELQHHTAMVRRHVAQDSDARCRRILARLRVNAALRWMEGAVQRKADALIEQVLQFKECEWPVRDDLVQRMEQLDRVDGVAHEIAQDALAQMDEYRRSIDRYWAGAAHLYAERCVALLRSK